MPSEWGFKLPRADKISAGALAVEQHRTLIHTHTVVREELLQVPFFTHYLSVCDHHLQLPRSFNIVGLATTLAEEMKQGCVTVLILLLPAGWKVPTATKEPDRGHHPEALQLISSYFFFSLLFRQVVYKLELILAAFSQHEM